MPRRIGDAVCGTTRVADLGGTLVAFSFNSAACRESNDPMVVHTVDPGALYCARYLIGLPELDDVRLTFTVALAF